MRGLRLLALLLALGCTREPPQVIEYRGQRIALSRAYADFDEYKNDSSNIAAFETERVQRLVLDAPMPRRFASILDAAAASNAIAFPGYGSGGFVAQEQDGTTLMGFEVEIPRAGKTRYFVLQGRPGRFDLVDEFVQPDGPYQISYVRRRGDSLVFFSELHTEVLRRAPALP